MSVICTWTAGDAIAHVIGDPRMVESLSTDRTAHAAPRWRQVPTVDFLAGLETWQRDLKDGHLTVIVGKEPNVGWHMSISHRTNHAEPRPGRYPKWGEIKEARYRFVPADVTMCMILPPPDEYVNVHETCFHLWEHPDEDG